MSESEKEDVIKSNKRTKTYSLLTAIIVLVRTIVDIFFK